MKRLTLVLGLAPLLSLHQRPDLLETLFASIRIAAPALKTLHIDNTNPATITKHEPESRKALQAIIRHHTSGDVAAFGMETADPEVVKMT